MIFGLFRSRKDETRIYALYTAIVAQARQPEFYADLGVPDTLEGRYEMLMLHAVLYMHRLKDEPAEVKDVSQKVFDLMFNDMDRSLRELGVGDLSVPKKIKKMAQAFYGRANAYDSAIAEGPDAVAACVLRNVFAEDETMKDEARTLADYIARSTEALAQQEAQVLITKGPVYPSPKHAGGTV